MEFLVDKAEKLSPILARSRPVDAGLVALWTKHWRETGFLH